MDKPQASFGDELKSINDELDLDVGKILRLAKADSTSPESNASKPPPISRKSGTSPQPKKPAKPPTSDADRDHAPHKNEPRINVTTRLTQGLNQRLTEAALRQKLNKQKPDTRQDIIEIAIVDWLSRRGSPVRS